jgi:hypothetical protein
MRRLEASLNGQSQKLGPRSFPDFLSFLVTVLEITEHLFGDSWRTFKKRGLVDSLMSYVHFCIASARPRSMSHAE